MSQAGNVGSQRPTEDERDHASKGRPAASTVNFDMACLQPALDTERVESVSGSGLARWFSFVLPAWMSA